MIKPLTSLRFVFAFMVFMSHAPLFEEEHNPFLYHLFKEGYVGVSFFFILSGFILSYTYQNRFTTHNITKRTFYTARFARIYPLHLLTLLIWVYMRKDHPINKDYITNFISNIFLAQSFYPTDHIRFNAVAWSLSDEMFFYLLFPFIVGWFVTARNKLLAVFAGSTFLILMLCPIFSGHRNEEWFFYAFPPVRLLDFVWGILLYNLCNRVKSGKKWKPRGTLPEVLVLIIFLLFYFSAYFIPQVYRHSLWYWIPVGLLISVFFFNSGCISKILSNRRLVLLGEISFAFYMVHTIVLWYVKRAFFLLDIQILDLVIFILGVIISVVVSLFSFKYFETPVNKWLKKKMGN